MKKIDMSIYKNNKAMSEEERSILNLGGLFTAISAILYVVITIMIAVDPVGMYISGEEGFEMLLNKPYINIGWRLLFSIQNIINIFIIPAFVLYVSKNNHKYYGILNALKIIMLAGVIIAAVNWVHFVEVTNVMMNEFTDGYSLEKITEPHYFPIDSFFLWTWGLYGFGFLCTNIIALKTKKFSPKMGILGIVCGVQLISLVVFYISGSTINIGGVVLSSMMLSAGMLGGITGPIFMYSCRKYYLA